MSDKPKCTNPAHVTLAKRLAKVEHENAVLWDIVIEMSNNYGLSVWHMATSHSLAALCRELELEKP